MSVLLCDNVSKQNIINKFSFNFLNNNIYAILSKDENIINTLLDLLSNKSKPTKGTIYLDGMPISDNKNINTKLSYINKNINFNRLFSIKGILSMYNKKYPKWDNYLAYSLINLFKLDINSKWSSLTNQKRNIVKAICVLSTMANITIFDDTLLDCDVYDRYSFYNILYNHKLKYPRTFIIITDRVSDISHIFDKILFVANNTLISYFTPNEIKSTFTLLKGESNVLDNLIKGYKIISLKTDNNISTACCASVLSKDERRKLIKYNIEINDVPIELLYIYLSDLRESKLNNHIVY